MTPFLNNDLILSVSDHPNILSCVTHTDVRKCNLNCYKCHNKIASGKEAHSKTFDCRKMKDFVSEVDVFMKLGCELLIISGGEPLLFLDKIEKVISGLEQIIPIRIDTNGTFPEKVEILKKDVQGFGVDIKIPLLSDEELTEERIERYSKILGGYNVYKYIRNVKETISLVDGMKYTIYRTVNYPLFVDEDKEMIVNFIKNYKSSHIFNDFIDLE